MPMNIGEADAIANAIERRLHFYFQQLISAADSQHLIARLDLIFNQLLRMEAAQMATLADIQAKVTSETTVVGRVVTLLGELSQQLKDALAANDPQAIQAIADQLDANQQALANAVAADTPAATPTPAPAP